MLVFARAPVAGRAKTRLVPALGAWRAARLQRRMTLRTLGIAAPFRPEIHGAGRHSFFRSLPVAFVPQKGRDLGERMHNAAARALRRHRAVIIVGTDSPALTTRDLRRAARLLRSRDAVLMPAEDGGYALIGLSKARKEIFRGIAWGSAAVFADTVSRIRGAGLRWTPLRTVWDVDRPEDLGRLRSLRFPSGSRRAARR